MPGTQTLLNVAISILSFKIHISICIHQPERAGEEKSAVARASPHPLPLFSSLGWSATWQLAGSGKGAGQPPRALQHPVTTRVCVPAESCWAEGSDARHITGTTIWARKNVQTHTKIWIKMKSPDGTTKHLCFRLVFLSVSLPECLCLSGSVQVSWK